MLKHCFSGVQLINPEPAVTSIRFGLAENAVKCTGGLKGADDKLLRRLQAYSDGTQSFAVSIQVWYLLSLLMSDL